MHSRLPRRLVVASLGVALGALAAVNVAVAGPNDGAIAALHDEIGAREAEIGAIEGEIGAIEGEIGAVQARIGAIEGEIGTIEQQIVDLRALVAQGDQAIVNLEAEIAEADARMASEDHELEVLQVRIELLADLTIEHYVDLDEPTTVRHVMAIDSYVKNDERMNAVLTQSVEVTSETLDNLRTQMLYEAVIDSATKDLHQRYARLRLDGDRALTLYDLMASSEERHRVAVGDRDEGIATIPTVEGRIASSEDEIIEARTRIAEALTQIAEARTQIAAEQAQIATEQVRIEDVHESIADTLAEIAWLESFNVSMAWTGLQGRDPDRPALAVKIDNASAARPQTGIIAADVVYEEIVEAGLTRFVAIFQTTSPGTVGPVRSGRTSDPILLEGFDRPLFAYSGANRGTNQIINASPLVDVGYDDAASAYWRSSSRRAPHNLYASTDSLWELHAGRTDVSPAPFTFGWEGQPLPDSAIAAEGVTIDFGRLVADYAWDGSGWRRSTNGDAHYDAAGTRIAPTNVVVQFTTYGKSPADNRSPEARTTGSGTAWVFTAGHLIVAEWHRPDPGRPATITVDGEPVLLRPGRTWVALADAARPGNVSWR